MPLSGILSKVTGFLGSGKDFAESKITELLASRYPDLSDVMVVMDKIKARVKDDEVDALSPKEDDGKWRPALLTVALLVKLQKLNDHMEDPTAAVMSDNEAQSKLLLVFGAYWHICTQIGKGLRSFEHDSQGLFLFYVLYLWCPQNVWVLYILFLLWRGYVKISYDGCIS